MNSPPLDEKKPADAGVESYPNWLKLHPEGSWEDLRRKVDVIQFMAQIGLDEVRRLGPGHEGVFFATLQSRVSEVLDAVDGLQSLPPAS